MPGETREEQLRFALSAGAEKLKIASPYDSVQKKIQDITGRIWDVMLAELELRDTAAEEAFSVAQKSADALKKQIEGLQKEVSELRQDLTKMEEKNRRLQNDLDEEKEKAAAREELIASLKSQVVLGANQEELMSQLNAKINQFASQLKLKNEDNREQQMSFV